MFFFSALKIDTRLGSNACAGGSAVVAASSPNHVYSAVRVLKVTSSNLPDRGTVVVLAYQIFFPALTP
jgi:hypothetical protein